MREMSSPFRKLDTALNDANFVCRGCLVESGEMKNMLEWGLADDYSKFTDVQIRQTDNFSNLLCTKCEDILIKCRDFKIRCQNSDSLLRNMVQLMSQSQQSSVTNKKTPDNNVSFVLYEEKLIIMILAPDTLAKVYLTCPYCCTQFQKKKDLLYHLTKTHEINEKKFTIELQYFCSHENCSYHPSSGKNCYFKERKFLNQHYLKVHKSKDIRCEDCSLSFYSELEYKRHLNNCNVSFSCQKCSTEYKTHERLLVHLMRKHPEVHKQYKNERKLKKRKSKINIEPKKVKTDFEKLSEYMCDSPKRSFATQTLKSEDNIKNDVTLPSWQSSTKKDEISTQTVFEDLLSLKSQTSEDDSLFCSETVSLSDIQTQTFPLEFGLSRCNKETITSETQSPDLSMKETQTCLCLYELPKPTFRLFDSISSSPSSLNFTSTETQTADDVLYFKSDGIFGLNTAETQTSFEDEAGL